MKLLRAVMVNLSHDFLMRGTGGISYEIIAGQASHMKLLRAESFSYEIIAGQAPHMRLLRAESFSYEIIAGQGFGIISCGAGVRNRFLAGQGFVIISCGAGVQNNFLRGRGSE